MNNQKDKWVEEGWYDCCSGCPVVSYTLYDASGGWLYSVSDVRYIPMYYYLKDTTKTSKSPKSPKTYKDYAEELEKGTLSDYSHLYEVIRDNAINYSWHE